MQWVCSCLTVSPVLCMMLRSDIKFLVLDEADQMLDIGFKDAIEEILAAVTGPHQTLLYSATIPEWVNKTARTHMKPDKVRHA